MRTRSNIQAAATPSRRPSRKAGNALRVLVALLAAIAGVLVLRPASAMAATTCQGAAVTIQGTSAAETIPGTPGDDVIDADAGNDTVDGAGGNDIVCGGDGNDTLAGGTGNDTLAGGGGDDVASFASSPAAVTASLVSGTATGQGSDTMVDIDGLSGSPGADRLTGSTAANVLKGEAGNDTLYGRGGNDTLDGGAGIDTASFTTATPGGVNANLATGTAAGDGSDTLVGLERLSGSARADTLTGDGGANVLTGSGGDDTLVGGAGTDTLTPGTGNDSADGGTGTDTASYAASVAPVNANLGTGTATGEGNDTFAAVERLTGSAFADTLTGDGGANLLNGGSGDDALAGGGGNDTLTGGVGTDTATYAAAPTPVNANLGTATATGEGNDTFTTVENLTGSPAGDTLAGDGGANAVNGGSGDDALAGGGGDDTLDGSTGTDTASYAASATAVSASLGTGSATGEGSDTLVALENLTGSPAGDTLTGDAGANALAGGPGDDTLDGAGGTDTLTYAASSAAVTVNLAGNQAAGDGADTLAGLENVVGSAFADTLTGDANANAFDGGPATDTCNVATGVDTTTSCEVVEGTVDAGSVDAYSFTVPADHRIFLDYLTTTTCGITWSLSGPGGSTVFTSRGICSDPGHFTLAAGTYTLKVTGSAGTYSFRWWDVPAPQSFSYAIGDPVSNGVPAAGAGNIEAPGAVDTYTFSATSGEKVFVDHLSSTTCAINWRLSGPGGVVVFPSRGICSDPGPLTLAAGTYALTVDTATNSHATGSYSFRITDIPAPQNFAYAIGDTVSNGVPAPGAGNIEVPGAVDVYSFSASAGQKVYVNFLSSTTCAINWRLSGPAGAVVFASRGICADPGQLTLAAAGTYTLTVDTATTSAASGAYSFRITDVPAPQSFGYTIGDTVGNGVPAPGAGNIGTPGAVDSYTFSATAGQRVFVDHLTSTNCNLHWHLSGPGGAVVFASRGICADPGQLTLATTGTYTLTVDTATTSDATGTHSFRITDVPAPQSFAYTIGNTVSNGVPAPGSGNIETPGAVDSYTFSATAGQKVLVDYLTASACNELNWRLSGPSGVVVFPSRPFCADPGQFTVTATGTYTLTVDTPTTAATTGTYSFRIINI